MKLVMLESKMTPRLRRIAKKEKSRRPKRKLNRKRNKKRKSSKIVNRLF